MSAIQKNPFLKYVMKDEKKDVFHSSAYAQAQNGANMGSASTKSFRERMKMERSRQVVKGYRDSGIMSGAISGAPRPKTAEGTGKPPVKPLAKPPMTAKSIGISVKK